MLTPEALAAIQGVGQTIIPDEMKSVATVMHRTRDPNPDNNPYGSSDESYVETNTYLGWLVGLKASDLTTGGAIISGSQEFELRLPVTAIVATGDQVEIGGAVYTVQNTNNEDTIPTFMKATLRRVE